MNDHCSGKSPCCETEQLSISIPLIVVSEQLISKKKKKKRVNQSQL